MGAGSVLEEGRFRFSLNVARGFAFKGGHLESKGLDATGQIIAVPLHRHDISLDYLRLEMELEYKFKDRWGLLLRIPYDIKDQMATVGFIASATGEEKEATLRNRDIHHRTESYRSLSDLMLLVNYRRDGLFREKDLLKISWGTTLPTGKTEENPYELGDQGLKHLHIQFGTGTFNPLLELNHRTPLAERFSLGAYALGQFPFYQNDKTYQGSVEVTSGLILGYRVHNRLFLQPNASAYYQNSAYWDGQKDTNSGLLATSGMFGIAVKAWEDTTLAFDVGYPFSQRTLAEGDIFEQGPILGNYIRE